MNLFRRAGWRLALAASGIALLVGGPMHPESDAHDSMRHELATMTADDAWVPGHSLILLSTVLLAAGLWAAYRSGVVPASAARAWRAAAIAFSLYSVETVFHLAAAADSDALANGDVAPLAYTHVALSVVLSPLAGAALVWLAVTLLRTVGPPRGLVALPGIAAGVLMAVSVPATLALPDVELSPVFAMAAVTTAVWSIGTAAAGIGPVRARRQALVPVG
jgi:hypothetical protein